MSASGWQVIVAASHLAIIIVSSDAAAPPTMNVLFASPRSHPSIVQGRRSDRTHLHQAWQSGVSISHLLVDVAGIRMIMSPSNMDMSHMGRKVSTCDRRYYT